MGSWDEFQSLLGEWTADLWSDFDIPPAEEMEFPGSGSTFTVEDLDVSIMEPSSSPSEEKTSGILLSSHPTKDLDVCNSLQLNQEGFNEIPCFPLDEEVSGNAMLPLDVDMSNVMLSLDALQDFNVCSTGPRLLPEEEISGEMLPSDAIKKLPVYNSEPSLAQEEEEEEEGRFPVGYRFCPTDKELLHYYLRGRLSGSKFHPNTVKDFDVYSTEPWNVPGADNINRGAKESVYLFVRWRKKSGNNFRAERGAGKGFWRAGSFKVLRDNLHQTSVIGYFRQLTYHIYTDDNNNISKSARKTNWIMHEYTLTKSPEMALCRIKKNDRTSSSVVKGFADSMRNHDPEVGPSERVYSTE